MNWLSFIFGYSCGRPRATSSCVRHSTDTRAIYAHPPQLCTTPRRGAATGGLCAPLVYLASPVTRVVDGYTLVGKFAGGYGSAYHPYGPAYREYAAGDDFDPCGWDSGRGPRRALYHHGDHVEDGLSECETVFACLDYDGNGNHFDVDTDIDFAGGRSG